MWRGSMIEMPTRGNQCSTESAVTSQPVQNIIPLGPFANPGESDWHCNICFSCSPALCVRCECCSKTNVCNCGFPWIQAFCCDCCKNIPLAHLSTKLEAAGVDLRIGLYGILYVHVALVILQLIIFNKIDIRVPVSVYSCFALLVTFYLRGKMRNELKIRGNVVGDFVCSFFVMAASSCRWSVRHSSRHLAVLSMIWMVLLSRSLRYEIGLSLYAQLRVSA